MNTDIEELMKTYEKLGMLNMKSAVLIWIEEEDLNQDQIVSLLKAMNDAYKRS